MPHKSQLVCQHLEGISGDSLEDYQVIIRECVHRRQGVYAGGAEHPWSARRKA
jgi:hypothetical protein